MYENETWIYFDHWAVRHFAEGRNAADRERVLAALHRGAFIAYSWMNVLELARNRARSLKDQESFLHAIGTRLRVIDSDPTAVVRRTVEGQCRERVAAILPGFGPDQLEGGDNTTIDLAAYIHDQAPRVRPEIELLLDRRAEVMVAARTRRDEFEPPHPESAVSYYWHALSTLVVTETFKIKRTDAADSLHAPVALAVCDFVLLDPKWCDLVRKLKNQPMRPRVFPKSGIGAFLDALERFTPPTEVK